uniref:Urokinase plasminogen activator surface receptor-like n=1 Tax=Oreochromis niloticus TaxID=8128 RepID=A0A669CKY3_ORENI
YNSVKVCLCSTDDCTNYCTVSPSFFKRFILANVLEFVHALEARNIIVIFIFVLSACALKCYECIPGPSGSCTDTIKECPFNTQCASARTTSYAGGSKVDDYKGKDCVTPEDCVQASINFGDSQFASITKCCTTDLCNHQDAPEYSFSPNGKKCFYCDGTDCTKTLKCNKNEDYCVSLAGNRPSAFSVYMFILFCFDELFLSFISSVTEGGQNVTRKGCASKLVCSSTQSAKITVTGPEISCCQGNFCNSASSTTVSLLLFVTPVISLVLFT